MSKFDRIDNPEEQEGDRIVICLGQTLTEEQLQSVADSIAAFMNKRWPNLKIGLDS